MDEIIEYLSQLLENALQDLYEIFKTVIIDAIVNFFSDIVEYFKSLALKRDTHVPFIMSTEESSNNPLQSLISDKLKGTGVIEGVYNKETDSVDNLRYIGGSGIDEKTKEIVKNNPITVFN